MGTGFSSPFIPLISPFIHMNIKTKKPRMHINHPKIGIIPIIPNINPVKPSPRDCLI